MFSIIIDNREIKLIELFKTFEIPNFKLYVKPLKIGDILILNSSENLDIETCSDEEMYKLVLTIFERKTCQDLLSSINDGRYREQKARLIANFNLNQICYLIENDISPSLNKYRKNGRQIVIGALVNKCFRDNIKIIKTSNIIETCDFLLNICKKVSSNPEFFQCEENKSHENTYTSSVKISKRDNITPSSFATISLAIIPGVSDKMANNIIEKYGSLNSLIKEINKVSDDNLLSIIKEIGNIQIDITGGKKRRIGDKVSERIVKMLLG